MTLSCHCCVSRTQHVSCVSCSWVASPRAQYPHVFAVSCLWIQRRVTLVANHDNHDIALPLSCIQGLPSRLRELLLGRQPQDAPVEDVCLGPKGEWFVVFADGTYAFGNAPEALVKAVQQVGGPCEGG